jgi:hypothetical protein
MRSGSSSRLRPSGYSRCTEIAERYFDVFVEYGKGDVDDICIRITVANRGARPAELSLIPTLWFRNT